MYSLHLLAFHYVQGSSGERRGRGAGGTDEDTEVWGGGMTLHRVIPQPAAQLQTGQPECELTAPAVG